MNLTFVFVLVIVLVVFYLNNYVENFSSNLNSKNYEPIQYYPMPPNPLEPDIDYQDYLDTVSGYDGATRSYDNPLYAQQIANDLDTN